MPELGGEKTRRNSLTIILRYFVPTVGGGPSRRAESRNVWAAFARVHSAEAMAPAFLAHVIAQNEVAQEASRFIARRWSPGHDLTSNELRRQIVTRFGERKVVTNAVSAFLRTLQYFGVLADGERLGQYRFADLLPLSNEIFPMIVWVWWQAHLTPQIDLDEFQADPALAFLKSDDWAAYWRMYQPALWAIEERLDVQRATLKYGEAGLIQESLTDLLPAMPAPTSQ